MKRHCLFFISCCILGGLYFYISQTLHAEQKSEKIIPIDPSSYPNAVVVDSLHHKAYITSHSESMQPLPITIIDTLHDVLLGSLPVSTDRAIVINSRENRLYIQDSITNSLAIFDTATGQQIATVSSQITPNLLSVNETTNTLYAISNHFPTGGAVQIMDGNGKALSGVIPLSDTPRAVAVNAVTNMVYIATDGENPQLYILDGSTNSISSTISLPNPVSDISIDENLDRIYLASDTSTDIQEFDGKTHNLLSTIPMINMVPCAHSLASSSIDDILYAACFNGLSSFNLKTNSLIEQIPLIDELPVSHEITSGYFSFDKVLNKLYIPLEETHEIAVVSLASPPHINPISTQIVHEGDNVKIPILFSDTVGTSWTINVDFGDNTQKLVVANAEPGQLIQHSYQSPGEYRATILIVNNTGATSTLAVKFHVLNISPTVGSISYVRVSGRKPRL